METEGEVAAETGTGTETGTETETDDVTGRREMGAGPMLTPGIETEIETGTGIAIGKETATERGIVTVTVDIGIAVGVGMYMCVFRNLFPLLRKVDNFPCRGYMHAVL